MTASRKRFKKVSKLVTQLIDVTESPRLNEFQKFTAKELIWDNIRNELKKVVGKELDQIYKKVIKDTY